MNVESYQLGSELKGLRGQPANAVGVQVKVLQFGETLKQFLVDVQQSVVVQTQRSHIVIGAKHVGICGVIGGSIGGGLTRR